MVEPIRVSTTVATAPAEAFAVFTQRLGDWWPHEYTWSGDELRELRLTGRCDGLASEIGPWGFRIDWGRVTVWEPPTRLVLCWHVAPGRVPDPNPQRASVVELGFRPAPDGTGTVVALEHRHFERHGEGAAAYRDRMAAPEGWPYLLECFRAHVEARAGRPAVIDLRDGAPRERTAARP